MRTNFFSTYKTNGILFYLIPVAVFCFWLFVYPYTLMNQELFSLFLMTPDFLLEQLKHPGGLSDYAGWFVVQFFHYSWLAALCQTAAFITAYFLTSRITRKLGLLTKAAGILYLPALTLLGLQMQYEFLFSETIKVIAYLAIFYGYICIAGPKTRLLVSLVGAPLFLMLLGGGIFIWLYVLFVIYELAFAPKRLPVAGLVSWLVIVPALPQIYRRIALIPQSQLYGLFPKLSEYSYSALPTIMFLWLPVFLLLGWGVQKYYTGNLSFGKITTTVFNLLVIVAAAWVLKATCYYPHVEQQFHMYRAVTEEKWDEVLDVAKDYKNKRYSAIVLYNIALAQKGQLADSLLNYQQIGVAGLLHPWEGNYFSHLHGSEVFYRLGEMNEALRWAFEAAVCKADATPPHLTKRIVEILIQLEKYEATRPFLYQLVQTWNYGDWARKTLRTLPTKAVSSPRTAETDFICGTYGPFFDLSFMSQNRPANTNLRDYFLTSLLLEKKIENFYADFCEYFRPGNKMALPKIYEEALIIVYQKGIDRDVFKKYHITQECGDRFTAYSEGIKAHGLEAPETPKLLAPKFHNTYWYYFHFNTEASALY